MEKRLILAMFLIFLTTMVWYSVMLPPSTDHPKDSGTATVDSVVASDMVRVPALVDSVPAIAADSTGAAGGEFDLTSPGQIVTIKTDYYMAEVNTRGAALQSWLLEKFKGYLEGARVEKLGLIERHQSTKNMTFAMPIDGHTVDFSRVTFQPNKKEITLTGAGAVDTLLLSARKGDREVIVSYIVSNTGYSLELDIQTRQVDLGAHDVYFTWSGGLNLTERDISTEEQFLAGMLDADSEIINYDYGKISKKHEIKSDAEYRWLGIKNHYFAFIVAPQNTELQDVTFWSDEKDAHLIQASWRIPGETLGHNQADYQIYLGPQNYEILKTYHQNWEGVVDFGWDWMEPLSRLILGILTFLKKFIPNYGLVVVIFSILTKIVFYPLMQKQLKSMKAMQELQPEMERLKKKFEKDPQKLNQEMLKLYQTHKINPLSGCLPILVQMPIFMALYNVMRTTIYMRDAQFLWLTDLSQNPDISIVGAILPLLMGGSMFVTQKMSSSSTAIDPRQQMMLYMLPVVFTIFSFQWATGLILYWFVNNILTIIQQAFINSAKKKEAGDYVIVK